MGPVRKLIDNGRLSEEEALACYIDVYESRPSLLRIVHEKAGVSAGELLRHVENALGGGASISQVLQSKLDDVNVSDLQVNAGKSIGEVLQERGVCSLEEYTEFLRVALPPASAQDDADKIVCQSELGEVEDLPVQEDAQNLEESTPATESESTGISAAALESLKELNIDTGDLTDGTQGNTSPGNSGENKAQNHAPTVAIEFTQEVQEGFLASYREIFGEARLHQIEHFLGSAVGAIKDQDPGHLKLSAENLHHEIHVLKGAARLVGLKLMDKILSKLERCLAQSLQSNPIIGPDTLQSYKEVSHGLSLVLKLHAEVLESHSESAFAEQYSSDVQDYIGEGA